MTEDAAFLEAIRENPADPTPRLVYADWLDEHGQTDLAFAYRWSVRKNHFPCVEDPQTVSWYLQFDSWIPQASYLPHVVYHCLCGGSQYRRRQVFHGLHAAFVSLAQALRKLRDIL